MNKPFKTIEEQIDILNGRGLKTDDEAKSILLREGYYNVVNGYKEPFIDRDATSAVGDDRYRNGTTFTDVHALFLFDRELRERTFHYALKAEALLRTTCSYCFADAHRNTEDYLLTDNFSRENEYSRLGLTSYVDDMYKLQNILLSKARGSKREPIAHYRDHFGGVPLWILSLDLTFGNMEHFFNLMKPKEQTNVCRLIAEATGRLGDKRLGFYDPLRAHSDINTIVKVRNLCAHDERLYCARIGKRKHVDFAGFLLCIERFLTDGEFCSLLSEISRAVDVYSNQSELVAHIMDKMGFTSIGGTRHSGGQRHLE